MTRLSYVARSKSGQVVASFDTVDAAVQFQRARAERGVKVRLYRQEIIETEVES